MKTKVLFTVFAAVLSGMTLLSANEIPTINRDPKPTGTPAVAYYNAIQIMCGGCVNKVRERLIIEYGVIDVEPDLPTKDVKITYDPEKITPEEIKASFKKFDYTVNSLNPNEKDIVSVILTSEKIGADTEKQILDKLSSLKGVTDVNINFRTNAVGIAYNKNVINHTQLADALKEIGIETELYDIE